MSQIRRQDGAMAVTFGNDTRIPAERPGFTGTVSQISWDNVAVMQGLERMFAIQPGERIVAIEVDQYGIKAKFERRTLQSGDQIRR